MPSRNSSDGGEYGHPHQAAGVVRGEPRAAEGHEDHDDGEDEADDAADGQRGPWPRTRRAPHQRRPQARVEGDREEVRDEVGDDVRRGDDQRVRLDDRHVTGGDRADEPSPMPG